MCAGIVYIVYIIVCIVQCSAVYNVCIMYNSIYQYVSYVMCDWMKQGTFDTLTGSQSNDRTLSKCLYDSLPVCQIIKQFAICCCLMLFCICALSLCLLSGYLGRSFLLCCCEGSVLSLWGFLFSGAVMFGVVSGDSVILFRLYYCVSYYLIFIIYYYL